MFLWRKIISVTLLITEIGLMQDIFVGCRASDDRRVALKTERDAGQ